MGLRMLTKVALLVGLPITVHAEPSTSSPWLRVGQTDAECSFSAKLDLLSGYPFARIVIQDGASIKVVPLAESARSECDSLSYLQVPDPSLPPTFEVLASSLCMSRLPSYVVTRSLSGVQETCNIEL